MRIYAQRPGRVVLQVLADVAVLVWVLLVVALARGVRAAVLTLQAPAQRLTGAGDSISGAFADAARTASGVPFVGDDLGRALGTGTAAGTSLASSGRDLSTAVEAAGLGVAAAIVLVGVLPVVAVWLVLRVRWVLAARSARRAGPDLLALHALTRRAPAALRRAVGGSTPGRSAARSGSASDPGLLVPPDPAVAWRRGDPAAVTALAALELAALGLR